MFNDKFCLTQAVLEGRKTMTRRIVPDRLLKDCVVTGEVLIKSPYKVGEVVAVAQSYKDIIPLLPADENNVLSGNLAWAAFGMSNEPGYTNKMLVKADLMPYQIRITDIEVERLQDISDEDCLKEGVFKGRFRDFPNDMFYPYKDCKDTDVSWTARQAFALLIDEVSGKGTWERNPWVFAYTFELEK